MVGLFALRCVLPLALTVFIGYLMNRLVDRWERAEAAETQSAPASAPALAVKVAKPDVPCWVFRNCDEAKRANCPGGTGLLPCWLARMRVEGKLPTACADCPLYDAPPELAFGD